MITISELHPGRFGNKILHYNNLAQIAKFLEIDYNSVSCPVYSSVGVVNSFSGRCELEIDASLVLSMSKDKFKDLYLDKYINRTVSLLPCLGELFFHFNHNTRDIFNVSKPVHSLTEHTKNIGIHFRGTDFHNWNQQSILSKEYYINCIEDTLDMGVKYYIFTDDKNLISYKQVIEYLEQKNIDFELGHATRSGEDFMHDFLQLCDTDIIISSPSTFAICAGFMGREKRCYHSKKWVESRKSVDDIFWVELTKNLNKNYILEKVI